MPPPKSCKNYNFCACKGEVDCERDLFGFGDAPSASGANFRVRRGMFFVYLLEVDYIEGAVGEDGGDPDLAGLVLEADGLAVARPLVVRVAAAGAVGAAGDVPRPVELCASNTEPQNHEHQVKKHHSRGGRGDLRIMSLMCCVCTLVQPRTH